MSKTVTGEENLYFELQSKDATTANVYEDMGVEGGNTPVTESGEKRSKVFKDLEHASSQLDAVRTNRRTLCIITAVVVVSFLTAAATIASALMMGMYRNSPNSSLKGKTDQALSFQQCLCSN